MPMSSSTSSSERPARAIAFVAAVVIIVAVEVALATALPRNPARHRTDEVLAALDGDIEARPLVVLGDSVTAGCLDCTDISRQCHDLTTTQAISTAGVYYTWRRLVERTGAPRVLALVVRPESWTNDLDQAFTPAYFETCFIRLGEIRDFATRTGRLGMTERMLVEALFVPPSLVRRSEVRRTLNRLRGAPKPPHVFRRRLDGLDPETAKELAFARSQETFDASEIAETYLSLLIHDTGVAGTKLVLLTPALPHSVAAAWEANGYAEGVQSWLSRLAAGAPHVVIDPQFQFADYADEDMYDGAHLKPARMRDYGERLSERLEQLLATER